MQSKVRVRGQVRISYDMVHAQTLGQLVNYGAADYELKFV